MSRSGVFRTACAVAFAVLPGAGCDDATGPGADSRPPTLQLRSPAAGAALAGDSVVVAGDASDDEGVARIAYSLNGGEEKTVEGGATPFGFVVRGTALGTNRLVVRAYDAAGNRGEASVEFTVSDAAPPALAVVSPTAGEMTERDSVAVAGTFSDDRRVVRLSYLLDGGAEQTVEGASGRAASFRFTVKPGPGEHRLEVRAYDDAGNRAAQTVAFTAASVEVRLTAPVPGTVVEAFAVRLHGYIDTPVRVDSVTYSVNGGAERPFCVPGYLAGPVCSRYDAGRHTFTWEADSLPRGDVRIQVFAYDSQRRKIGAGSARLRVSVPVRYYQVTPIDAPDGSAPLSPYSATNALQLNNRGQVLGLYGTYPDQKLFFWENGRAAGLGLRVEQFSPRIALNDSGQVAANAYPDDECQDLFTWKPGQGQPVRVGECNFLLDLDNRGRMLVLSKFGPVYRGALLTRDTITYLQGGYLGPRFVNDAGQVVGTASEVGEAWLSPDRAPQALGTPCDPKGLNDRGQLLCAASGGFVLSGGQKLPVAGIGREGSTTPRDINDRSQVVGTYALYSFLRTGATRAFVWDGGRTYAIETRSGDWEIEYAGKINDAGVILAQAVRRGVAGSSRAVLLTPEP